MEFVFLFFYYKKIPFVLRGDFIIIVGGFRREGTFVAFCLLLYHLNHRLRLVSIYKIKKLHSIKLMIVNVLFVITILHLTFPNLLFLTITFYLFVNLFHQ